MEKGKWNISVFWKNLILMTVLVLMSVSIMLVYSGIANRDLREKNVRELQMNLERGCETLTQQLYMTYAIPEAIQSTKAYEYIRDLSGGELPRKYITVLPQLKDDLTNQLYLQGENRECVIYLFNSNSIVSRANVYAKAEHCFDQYILFSETDSETVLSLLQEKSIVRLMPAEQITFGDSGMSETCLALIIHPEWKPVSVMTFYTEETIRRLLGFEHFPENSCLRLLNAEDTVLYEYNRGNGFGEETGEWLSAYSKRLRVTIQVWVPESYFDSVLDGAWQTSWLMTCLMALIGLLLCVLLSEITTRPIRDLAAESKKEAASGGTNEIRLLAGVIRSSRDEQARLRDRLISTLLARAFSGAILSPSDEAALCRSIICLTGTYQVAIIHTSKRVNTAVKPMLIRQLTEEYRCEVVNETETGVLFPGSEEHCRQLQAVLAVIRQQLEEEDEPLLAGVSGAAEAVQSFSAAVRQAYAAMPGESGVGLFAAELHGRTENDVLHLQYERLHRSILENDEAGSLALLDGIADTCRGNSAQELFYSIRHLLRRASEEVGVSLPEVDAAIYEQSRLPRDNIARLGDVLQRLFALIREKQAGILRDKQELVTVWMEKNFHDDGLCAAAAAEHFGVSEKRIYEMVRASTDMSFNSYLLYLRMRSAASLLCTTGHSVREISQMCGYQAVSTFYRVFKKYYGVTASEFRQAGGVIREKEPEKRPEEEKPE